MIDRILPLLSKTRWFDVIEISGSSTPVSFKNNRLHTLTERHNRGYGIRSNVNGRTGFSYTNMPDRLEAACNRALELAPFSDEDNFDLPGKFASTFEPFDKNAEASFDTGKEINKMEEAVDRIRSAFPEATVDGGSNLSIGSQRLVNSNGLDIAFRNSIYSASLSATCISDDGVRIDVWDGLSRLSPVPVVDLADTIVKKITTAKIPLRRESGRIPVIFTPRAFGRLLGIVASGLNARAVFKCISPFAGKIGESIFNPCFSLIDDPLLLGSPYSFPLDDEGVPSKTKHLIEGGVLNGYVTDLRHASKLGIEPSGNGMRGFASLPSPSFSNVIVPPGETHLSEMMRMADGGIIVEQFIGLGQSNTLTGDFSANLDLAFLVKDGQIAGRVKDCMLSGNLFSLLADDMILSSEVEDLGSSHLPFLMLPAVDYTERG